MAKGAAVNVTGTPRITVEPLLGAARDTTGAVTVKLTGVEFTTEPLESVTLAVIVTTPEVAGVHETAKGAFSAVPITVFPERKSTRLTVAPAGATALAVRDAVFPRATTPPLTGAVTETVGSALDPTVTPTAADITVAEFESVTLAVRFTAPVVLGVQVT